MPSRIGNVASQPAQLSLEGAGTSSPAHRGQRSGSRWSDQGEATVNSSESVLMGRSSSGKTHRAWGTFGIRMDQAIAQAVPEWPSSRVGPDLVRECAKIDVVLQEHIDKLGVEPDLTEPEFVKSRPADQVADARPVHGGSLVGDDNGAGGTGDPAHLAQGCGMIFEVGEAADRVTGVERRIREGQTLGLGPGQPP